MASKSKSNQATSSTPSSSKARTKNKGGQAGGNGGRISMVAASLHLFASPTSIFKEAASSGAELVLLRPKIGADGNRVPGRFEYDEAMSDELNAVRDGKADPQWPAINAVLDAGCLIFIARSTKGDGVDGSVFEEAALTDPRAIWVDKGVAFVSPAVLIAACALISSGKVDELDAAVGVTPSSSGSSAAPTHSQEAGGLPTSLLR